MKAVALKRYLPSSHPESLLDVELPDPVPQGRDLLVRAHAISVNPVDVKVRSPKDKTESSPRVLGWDASGVVEATGPDVMRARAGVGGRPGGPRDTHWTVQEGPEQRAPGTPLPCAGDRSPWAPRESASLSRASLPQRLLRWPPGRCLGWGQLGQVQVAKNAPDDAALGEVRQHPPPSCAPRAGQDVHRERLAQQPRPIQLPGALTLAAVWGTPLPRVRIPSGTTWKAQQSQGLLHIEWAGLRARRGWA
jgi:hypothetical protein